MIRTMLRVILLAGVLASPAFAARAQETVTVYKSPTCGCCGSWIDHLRANGFRVKPQDVRNPEAYRARFGIPQALGACHTAVVEGYAIEGHVPAQEIRRLLAERPKARGLAVPGMPPGAPGMASSRGAPYDVLLVLPDGTYSTYACSTDGSPIRLTRGRTGDHGRHDAGAFTHAEPE